MNHRDLSNKTLYEHYLKELALQQPLAEKWGPSEWTEFVYRFWRKQGEKLGYSVYHTGCNKEYLVDLCWLSEPQSEAEHVWMHLALESEWWGETDMEKLLDDFYRLMYIKAYQKVFVFMCKDNLRDTTVSFLARQVSRCRIRLADEEYLLLPHSDVVYDSSSLQERVQGFVVDNRGNMRSLGEPEDFIFRP